MGIEIDLFFGWENGIGVTRTGLWSLGMGNEILVIVPSYAIIQSRNKLLVVLIRTTNLIGHSYFVTVSCVS